MTDKTYVDFTTPVVDAAWLNDVNDAVYLGNNPGGKSIPYLPLGTGTVATTVQTKLRESVSVKDFGAVGDGVTDDTTAIQTALNHIHTFGGNLYIPSGNYKITSGLTFAANTALRPLQITGDGASSIITMSGATGFAGLTISGVAGVTRAYLTLKDFRITSTTTAISSNTILLSGLADYQLHNLVMDGNVTNGIQFSGTQQGEWSGGYVSAVVGGYFVTNTGASGGIGSNGCDLHGVSFNSTTNLVFSWSDTGFVRGNHFTGGAGIHITNGGYATLSITDNHFEPTNANVYSLKVTSGSVFFTGNYCLGTGTSPAIDLISADQSVITNNLVGANGITIAVTTARTRLTNNWINGTITNNSTTTNSFGNYGQAGSEIYLPWRTSASLFTIDGNAAQVLAISKLGGSSAYLQPVSNTDSSLQVTDSSGSTNLQINAITSALPAATQLRGKIMPGQDNAAFQSTSGIYAGTGVPNNANGSNGDFYFRGDTPATTNQRLYIKSAGVWLATAV